MHEVKLFIKKHLPTSIKRIIKIILRGTLDYINFYKNRYKSSYESALNKVKDKKKLKVAFLLIHESVWKYEKIYSLMSEDENFDPIVIVCPYIVYGDEVMRHDMEIAYKAFYDKGYCVVKSFDEKTNSWLDIKSTIKPDIVFFTNPWNLTRAEYQIENFLDTLTFYVPYGFKNSYLYQAHFNQPMQNLVWKFFVETPIHKELAIKYSKNKGKNVEVLGYPGMDDLLDSVTPTQDPWIIKDPNIKRVIWSPHHTIPGHGAPLDYSTFLDYCDFMLEIAQVYKDKIQIAFKPHPILKAKLSLDTVWGKEKTEAYFDKWNSLENTFLAEGGYVALFHNSDAIINDSGSFTVEYLYTGKPMAFLIRDDTVLNRFNEVGKMALEHTYLTRSPGEVMHFINHVILNEEDYKREARNQFFQNYIKPPHGKSASDNIFLYIKDLLKLNRNFL